MQRTMPRGVLMKSLCFLLALVLVSGMACLAGEQQGGELDPFKDLLDDEQDFDEMGGGRLNEILMAMEHGQPYDRASAIWSARRYRASRRITEKLIEFVRKETPEVASASAVALGEMKAKAALPVLREALRHESAWVQESAAYALGLIGDKSALDDLTERQAKEPGLSRWIYQDAIARVRGEAGAASPHGHSLRGASVYCFGAGGPVLCDNWRETIAKYGLKVDGAPPLDLNEILLKFGGPPDLKEFYKLFTDKDNKPQVDVVIVSGLLPYEFPPELRWKLFQFVRRGGSLVTFGNAMFCKGEIRTVEKRLVHQFAMPVQPWHSCLPQTLDSGFRPCLAGLGGGFRELVRSGVAQCGHGRAIVIVSAEQPELALSALECPLEPLRLPSTKGWGLRFPSDLGGPHCVENLLLQAVEGEEPFRALVDSYAGPDKIVAGKAAAFPLNLFSSSSDPGTLKVQIGSAERAAAEQSVPVDFHGTKIIRLAPTLELPWSLPDGKYVARFEFKTRTAESRAEWTFQVMSPLRLDWQFHDSYDEAGGDLAGQVTVQNQRNEPIPGLKLRLEVADGQRRTLQRAEQDVALRPGDNGPFPLRLHARDYRIGSLFLTLQIVQGETVLQRSERLLHRCGPYDFRQDLVYVPWNSGASPGDPRMRELLVESGFNGLWSLQAFPGWYNWGVFGPHVRCTPTWPGEFVEQTRMSGGQTVEAYAGFVRHRLPGFSILDPWDESPIDTVVSETGEDLSPTASALYRNWLKSRYFSLDALNVAWRGQYKLMHGTKQDWFRWPMPAKSRIPPPRPWNGDLTSWNQIWAWRGAEEDWRYYEGQLWSDTIFQECWRRAKKIDPYHPWHWSEAFHTRLYIGALPGQTSWESHFSRAKFGNTPSTIMLHFCYVYKDKRPEVVRYNFWDALAAGGRHFINWSPNIGSSQGLDDDTSIWRADYTLKPHGAAVADALRRVRAKEQVLLDSRNAHSQQVAFLYNGIAEASSGSATPRPLFEALLFGGILPDSLRTDSLRSQRAPLEGFRVLFLVGQRQLPESWQLRLEEWQKRGGTLLYAADFPFAYQGPRIETPGFAQFQAKVLGALVEHGVTPPIQVVDDNGLPEPSVQPALLETDDRSQLYLLAAPDWSLEHSQAFGNLAEHEFRGKTELKGNFAEGVKFQVQAPADQQQLWAELRLDEPFAAKVTVDGEPGLGLTVYDEYRSLLRAERGTGKTRWVAGPRFKLGEGQHELRIQTQSGRAEILRVWVVDDLLVEPKLICNLPNVREVYDVFNDRQLPRTAGGWLLTLRASYGEVYSLVTEELGPIKVAPQLLQSDTDRRLQLKVEVQQANGQLSQCRHALNINVSDAAGREVAGLFARASVKGWRVLTLYPALQDTPLPWTVRVKDLTSGRTASAQVTEFAQTPYESLAPADPLTVRALPLPWLQADVHLVPLRVRVANNRPEPLQGRLTVELAPEQILEGQPEMEIRLAAGEEKTFEWDAVLGRAQAIAVMDEPPRVWLRLPNGETREDEFDDLYILRWEKTPPLVTNLRPTEVAMNVQNFLERPIAGRLRADCAGNWHVLEPVPQECKLGPATEQGPFCAALKFKARLKNFADQSPEVYRMPLSLTVNGKDFAVGHDLVEVEKRRTWYAAKPAIEEAGGTEESEPEMPEAAVDAKQAKLWGLDWNAYERDTLIDFPCEVSLFAATNVQFPQACTVAVRVRGEEKVDVWLGGARLLTGKTAEGKAADALDMMGEKTVEVPAQKWLPLVIRYHRMSAYPNTDLVFMDAKGNVILTPEFRASPAADGRE